MPEGLWSTIRLVLQTRELGIAKLSATYPKALRAAINSTIRCHGRSTLGRFLGSRSSHAEINQPLPLSSDRHAGG